MTELEAWCKNKGFSTVEESVGALKEELGVSVKTEDGLYVFTYSQIDSPKMHPVVMECRGLITNNYFNNVCTPFKRFFNHGEALETTEHFDWGSAVAVSKEDGSLIKFFHHNNEWRWATRGTITAGKEAPEQMSFYDMVPYALGEGSAESLKSTLKWMNLDKNVTYLFELTSPYNRIVTPYEETKLYFLGAFDRKTWEDVSDDDPIQSDVSYMCNHMGVKRPQQYSFSSPEETKVFVESLSDMAEGVVLCDKNGMRLKMKASAYVAIHHLRGERCFTQKTISAVVVTGEDEEYLSYFPEDRHFFTPYQEAWGQMHNDIVLAYEDAMSMETQKERAMKYKDCVIGSVVLTCTGRGTSPNEVMEKQDKNKLQNLLLKYMTENELFEEIT